MKRLWVVAAMAPLMLAAAAAHADTDINNGTTAPINTTTDGNIVIGTGGSVNPTSGTAVTLNSNNSVTNNGTIQIQNQSNSTGILAVVPSTGLTGSIINTGAITVNDTTSPSTNSTTGIANGPFTTFNSNFGINVSGSGALNGGVNTSGTITVSGDGSAGIQIGAGGLSGSNAALTSLGTITVTGGDSGNAFGPSYGIHSLGGIGGPVVIEGAISATGLGATGVALDGGANSVDINGTISTTGFRSLTVPTETVLVNALTADQLQANGPALSIGASVPGGVLIESAVTDSSGTVTNPGGTVTSNGSAPAILIGGVNALTIGPGAGGAALFVEGTVSGQGLYQNFNATGIQIGTGAATVTLQGGLAIAGNVDVSTVATSNSQFTSYGQGTATGVLIAPFANVGSINVGGSLSVGSTSNVANTVTAIQIDKGGVVTTLVNEGNIGAGISGIGATLNGPAASGGTVGVATAVSDLSGTLSNITNSGTVSATITPIVPGQVSTGTTTAFDLRANTTGVTLTQIANTNAAVTPSITGDVLFGTNANATLDLEAGTLTGAVSFGSGVNSSLILNNGAQMTGALNSTGVLAANINNGQLSITNQSTIAMSSLHVGSAGSVIFSIDPANGTFSHFNVANTATLDSGAKIGLTFVSPLAGEASYTLINAGNLTASDITQSLVGQIPYLLTATVTTNTGTNGSVVVNAARRTAAQAGFNPAETSAYNAIFAALSTDSAVATDALSKTNRADFIHLYDQFLPDYAGGPFDSLVIGQGEIARAVADAPVKLQGEEARGWVQEIGYLNNRQDTSEANGYRAGGFGIIGGIERARGESALGVSAAFITDGVKNDRQGLGADLSSAALELGVYWRYGAGDGLNLHASANGGYVLLSNQRLLFDEDGAGTTTLFREAKSQWNGAVASGEFGASYQMPMGRFYLRPEAAVDYILLYESAFSEHGGGPAADLSVASRTNTEATATADMVMGMDFGTAIHWRPELTVGWRQIVAGGPSDTTAKFVSGTTSFTLSPQLQDRGGLLARLGLRAGGQFADFSADAGGVFNKDYQTYDARAVARFLF